MSERLIDAVCPHCGRLGTTVRVVLHEDGYTKLSRQCTDCGNEWVHTFDHDWLAVAKNKKLQADNERLTSDVALVSERVRQLSEERDYAWSEVEKLRAEIERLREALVLGSEVLASHQGSPQREWHSVGAWLYPGDSINVVSAPLPEIKVEP
jgi:predicted  nucleic acid-binding Zn-ribbon protein